MNFMQIDSKMITTELTSKGIAICFASSLFWALKLLRSVCICLSSVTEKLSLSSAVRLAFEMHSMVLQVFSPWFLSACMNSACVTRATWQTVTVWCAFKGSGLRFQNNIWSAKLFGASLLSGAVPTSPTLKALNILSLWDLAVDTNRGHMSFKKQMCAFLWQDTGSSLPCSMLYLIFSEELRFLWPIEHMLLGCHCACVYYQPTSGERD